ncbi:MAG: hypothetical protein Q9174_007241 [Haloplaca sp. 1 TL-2023]
MPLARQIAGKPIDEAIIQMRFSKKKAARDVKKHLEYARDEAIVKRGMGLGMVQPEAEQDADAKEMPASAKESNEELPPGLEDEATQEATPEAKGPQGVELLSSAKAEDSPQAAEQGTPSPQQRPGIVVEDKKGKRRLVTDTSSIYVDEAWVGRGSYSVLEYDFRARGRVHPLKSPETSITVRLKEEATRIRLMDEREQKRQNKKVWLPLPDRPVTAQRQYCLW